MAGNHYAKSAFSEELDLERPEYATPLGIAISARAWPAKRQLFGDAQRATGKAVSQRDAHAAGIFC